MLRLLIPLFAALVCPGLLSGCANTNTSNTARTGTEQLLISNAIDQALAKSNFAAFRGQKVFVDDKYIDAVDKNYLIASTRHHLLRSGAQLAPKAEDADIVLEMRSGVIGTDIADSFIGIPEITLPGMLTLPEVRLVNKTSQTGTAKVGMVAYDARSRQVLGDGGVSFAKADNNNWFVLGVGPFQNGTIRKETSRGLATPTQWPAAQFPPQIAFNSPMPTDPTEVPGRLQLTGGEKESVTE